MHQHSLDSHASRQGALWRLGARIELMRPLAGDSLCSLCGQKCAGKFSLKRHIEAKHEGASIIDPLMLFTNPSIPLSAYPSIHLSIYCR